MLSALNLLQLPRIHFVGNSPLCIQTGAFEGYGYCHSLSTPCLRATLPSEPARSVLLSLELAATCNTDRILMHDIALPGRAGFREDDPSRQQGE